MFKDVTSAESMKRYLVTGLAAGFAAGVLDKAFGVAPEGAAKATHGFDLGKTADLIKFGEYTFAQNGFSAVANTANNGGSLKDNVAQSAISSGVDVMSAGIYNRWALSWSSRGCPEKWGLTHWSAD